MWVKVDDELPTHHKVYIAGRQLGVRGTGRVLAVWLEALCWTNKHHKDGFLPTAVVAALQHDRQPLHVAAALQHAGIWEPVEGGWRIHDWAQYQLDGSKRAELAQIRADAGRRGAQARWQNGKKMAKNAPVPVPFASKEAKRSRAREQPLPPVVGVTGKSKYQPSTKGAWSCPHTPPCGRSTTKCIAQALAEAKAGKDG